ncbi:Aldo/keto reductase [Roridomyces roridus]|uniref:Aldo/keto reductase n=1 Tax=Roridomyces roridus TaxID=1738132 RepID=A0AAD7C3M0_9AGAR|nr:Aldo/keto reductase [Roridomyces roridus]
MSSEQKSAVNVVLGAMTFGSPSHDQSRVGDLQDVQAIIQVFLQHGHSELDTSRVYCGGTSEEYLGNLKQWLDANGAVVHTKYYPMRPYGMTASPEDLRKYLNVSLKALHTDKLDLWYLHGPDRQTPFEETLKAINDMYQEGLFKRWGISNYMSWEVAEMVGICKKYGYVQPAVYQGLYNAVHRAVEPELFPCLRKFGISFYAFNPLGGGFFTGRYTSADDQVEAGSRFDDKIHQGASYRKRYWNDPYFKALQVLRPVLDKHGLNMSEVALRWMTHHSLLKREHGDAILIGASSLAHIESNLVDLEKGPLPEEVVAALDAAWMVAREGAAVYYH